LQHCAPWLFALAARQKPIPLPNTIGGKIAPDARHRADQTGGDKF